MKAKILNNKLIKYLIVLHVLSPFASGLQGTNGYYAALRTW